MVRWYQPGPGIPSASLWCRYTATKFSQQAPKIWHTFGGSDEFLDSTPRRESRTVDFEFARTIRIDRDAVIALPIHIQPMEDHAQQSMRSTNASAARTVTVGGHVSSTGFCPGQVGHGGGVRRLQTARRPRHPNTAR